MHILLGKEKSNHQIHIGFALETTNEEFFAKKKLMNKNFDVIVLNSLNDTGAGFKHNTNKVTLYTKDDDKLSFELKLKTEVAT